MKRTVAAAGAALAIFTSCNTMENPFFTESALPYGAPPFDRIRNEHYIPAFEEGIRQAKAEIDAIVANPDAPDFANTIEALEYSGRLLDRVSGIFYNLNEADTDDSMQEIAEKVSPMMTEYSMYVSLNEKLFERVKAVYAQKDSLSLAPDQMKLLEDTYRSFARNGANLSPEDKELFSRYSEELSLLSLQFQKNSLAATNAFYIHVTDVNDLAGLPQYVRDMGEQYARNHGLKVEEFPAHWDLFGRVAGPKRNMEMAQFADAVIVFWDGKSAGTRNMIECAKAEGLPCKVIEYQD